MPDALTFVLSGWNLPSAGQQMLDRFLIGYPQDGIHHRPDVEVTVCPIDIADQTALNQRVRDFNLKIEPDLARSLEHATSVVIVWKPPGHHPDDTLLMDILGQVKKQANVFVLGPLWNTENTAKEARQRITQHSLNVISGSPLNTTWHLPEIDLKPDTLLTNALVVVQGASGKAEWDALESLLPLLAKRSGGEAGIVDIQKLEGRQVWKAGDKGAWSWDLLAAALSRSDSPQGDPVKDGRTQDLVGLGLVPTLAKDPRGWLLQHRDGLNTALLVLDGVVADYNLAIQSEDGQIQSAQILRPPSPAQQDYTRLAQVVEPFIQTGESPWNLDRGDLIAKTLRRFQEQSRS